MLTANVMGLTYHRTILEDATVELTARLKEDFDYSFIVCMGSFLDSSYEVVKKKSCLIDVTNGIDTVISKFNSTSRNEFRRTERTEGLNFMTGFDDFEEYYSFYAGCEAARQWLPVPKSELANSLVFSSTFQGQFISGMSCYGNGKRLRVGRIYSTKRLAHDVQISNTVYGAAAKRIVVEICRYAIANGFETVDLGGVDLSGAKSGITQFKLSLGGDIVDVSLGRYMNEKFKSMMPQIQRENLDIT